MPICKECGKNLPYWLPEYALMAGSVLTSVMNVLRRSTMRSSWMKMMRRMLMNSEIMTIFKGKCPYTSLPCQFGAECDDCIVEEKEKEWMNSIDEEEEE